jgi:hypothetical protein
MVTALRLLTERSAREAQYRVRGELLTDLLDVADRPDPDAASADDLGFAGLLLGGAQVPGFVEQALGPDRHSPDRALELQLALRLHRLR